MAAAHFGPLKDGRVPFWKACVFALAVTVLTLVVHLLLVSSLQPGVISSIFAVPILLSAIVGGIWPGLLATLACCLSGSYYLYPPFHSLAVASPSDRCELALLALVGIAISGLVQAVHSARRPSDAASSAPRKNLNEYPVASTLGEKYRAILDEQAAVAITDVHGTITFVNERFCRDSKFSRQELIGKNLRVLNSGFHSETFFKDFWSTIAAGKVWRGEFLNQAKDKTQYWADATIVPICEGKTPLEFVAIQTDITARKIAEQALRESQELFANAFKLSPDPITIVRLSDRVVLQANDALGRLWLARPEDIIGQSTEQFLHWLKEDERTEFMKRFLAAGKQMEHEAEFRMSDGRLLQLSLSVRMITFKGEACLLNILHDVTERKGSDEARKLAESRYRSLFEYAPDGILIADGQSNYIDANIRICKMLGYTREELIGLDASDIVAPEEIPEIAPALNAIKESGDYHREWNLRRKDGTLIPVEVIATVMPDGNLLAMIRDIAERKKIEEAAAHLVAIVESSDDALVGKDLNGIVRSWNKGAEKLFGYTAEDMIGQPIARIIPPERQQEETHILACISRGENVLHFETVRLRKDGQAVDIAITVSPIKNSTGRIVGASKLARNITQRKQADQEIQRLNSELEQRVVQRTGQLQAANEELEAFSYSVSHDLRAPLRAVNGFSQAVIEDYGDALPPDGLRQLNVIRQSAQRMGDLIDDLLSFSRLSRQAINLQEIDVLQLVKGLVAEMTASGEAKNVEFRVSTLPPCLADPSLLRQVWYNLLSNAVKYTGKRAQPRVEVGHLTENGEEIYFIRDNGCGFDMRYSDKLFGVFQRLHRAEEYEGTGVGLAIVQRIVKRHGGRVWATGVEDQGASFYFTLAGKKPTYEQH